MVFNFNKIAELAYDTKWCMKLETDLYMHSLSKTAEKLLYSTWYNEIENVFLINEL